MSAYTWASVVRFLDGHPDIYDRGDIMLVAGKNEDGYAHTIRCDRAEGFIDLDCEVLGRVGPSDVPMSRDDIVIWARRRDDAAAIADGAPALEGASA